VENPTDLLEQDPKFVAPRISLVCTLDKLERSDEAPLGVRGVISEAILSNQTSNVFPTHYLTAPTAYLNRVLPNMLSLRSEIRPDLIPVRKKRQDKENTSCSCTRNAEII
jgi:hypothetical protein